METVGLALLISIVATLFASVGLAGSTGYLAVMALFGVDSASMKSASLLLNGLVAVIGTLVIGRLQVVARPAGLIAPILVLL